MIIIIIIIMGRCWGIEMEYESIVNVSKEGKVLETGVSNDKTWP